MREGEAYATGCGLSKVNTEESSLEISPQATQYPQPVRADGERKVVIFNLETTCHGASADIVQIAAVLRGQTFSHYIQPGSTVSPQATAVTGLSVSVVGRKRHLLKNGETIDVVKSLEEVCKLFVSWMSDIGSPVLLVAHYCFAFDMRVLLNQFASCVGYKRAYQRWWPASLTLYPQLRP